MGQGQTAEPKWYKDAQKASTTHEALEKIKKKLAERIKSSGPESLKTAEVYFYLGTFLNQGARYTEALESYNNAIKIFQSQKDGQDKFQIAELYYSMGNAAFNNKDTTLSTVYFD
jgi:tetratricopeptide (TPR) repeat protein